MTKEKSQSEDTSFKPGDLRAGWLVGMKPLDKSTIVFDEVQNLTREEMLARRDATHKMAPANKAFPRS